MNILNSSNRAALFKTRINSLPKYNLKDGNKINQDISFYLKQSFIRRKSTCSNFLIPQSSTINKTIFNGKTKLESNFFDQRRLFNIKNVGNNTKEIIYELPFASQIRGFNLVANVFLTTPLIIVPYFYYNVEYFVGASIMAACASVIPSGFVRMWTNKLVEKVWIETDKTGPSKPNHKINTDTSKAASLVANRQMKQIERYVLANPNLRISITNYRILGPPKTTTIAVSDILPSFQRNIAVPTESKKLEENSENQNENVKNVATSSTNGENQDDNNTESRKGDSNTVKWVINDNKKLRTVYLFREIVNISPFVKAINKLVELRGTGASLPFDSKTKNNRSQLSDFEL
ncbi:hypothetical protein BB559_002861 [Furculomyces boomerangus]|uniref:Uncharacterized protein n=2 Tax=Harpellales TaxID=61421 RepID=A0A2T9YDT4_9FUNG|nr:hypothetical protein BB559_004598 [Furculomyces boomerangus]PVU94983.1 hypothetical protein BB559_002861 [Furculomyces boomerangus]PVZ98487.1 hypothetical protein BB558_005513 [Smittium angustum]